MFWLTYTASPQLLRCTSRLCFGTSPLFIVYYSAELTHFIIRTCLGSIADWMTSNLLCFNSSKTKFLLLGLKPQLDKIQSPALCLSNGVSVLPSASARNLGFIFDSNLTLADQISSVTRSCFYRIRDLRRIRPVLDFTTAQSIGTSFVHSRLNYCNSLYYGLPKMQLNRLPPAYSKLACAVVAAHPGLLMPTRFWNHFAGSRYQIA